MKRVLYAIVALCMVTTLGASELSSAYQKEYTFLKAQKRELEAQLKRESAQQQQALEEAKKKLAQLQEKLVAVSDKAQKVQEKVEKLSKKAEEVAQNGDLASRVLLQSTDTLKSYGIVVDESNQTSSNQKLQKAFDMSLGLYKKLSSVHTEKGKFYLPNGKPVAGDIVKVGNVAAYGIAKEAAGALAPAGEGKYKLWNTSEAADDAKALYAGKALPTLDIFLYENLDKEVAFKKEKTMMDTIKAGGVIGYIILGLGLIGLLLIALRIQLLLKSGSNVEALTKTVEEKLKTGGVAAAQEAIKGFKGSTARVLKATLRNITRDREHIEDIVMENILNESSNIDKFGSFVLVIAAVAPLLGLLGTVTGMIATFDIITEFGTGDPKLLSGGISEALVTTMLGLVVAIPLLLLGNLLSGWAQNIKDSMEQAALHIINVYEKTHTKSA